MSLVPGIFQINGTDYLRITDRLESDYDHSFILTPMVNILVGYFCNSHLADHADTSNRCALDHTGNHQLVPRDWRNAVAAIVGVVCLAISVLIYLPFVIASNRSQNRSVTF